MPGLQRQGGIAPAPLARWTRRPADAQSGVLHGMCGWINKLELLNCSKSKSFDHLSSLLMKASNHTNHMARPLAAVSHLSI